MSFPPTPPRIPSMADLSSPLRLAEGGGTEYERRLLGSAQHDAPPLASAERIAAALQVAVADVSLAPAPSTGARGASASEASRIVKPWALGIIGAGVIGAIVASQWPSAPDAASTSAASIAVVPTPGLIDPIGLPAQNPMALEPRLPLEPEPIVVSPPRPKRVVLEGSPGASTRAEAPARMDDASNLAAEVRAIETIQTLLAWGQAQQAASALAEYRRKFPQGELALEADLSEVDVALARGDRTRARALARSLVERPSASRYRERLRGLLEAEARPKRDVPERATTQQRGTDPLSVGSN